jgi:hypothetical protein
MPNRQPHARGHAHLVKHGLIHQRIHRGDNVQLARELSTKNVRQEQEVCLRPRRARPQFSFFEAEAVLLLEQIQSLLVGEGGVSQATAEAGQLAIQFLDLQAADQILHLLGAVGDGPVFGHRLGHQGPCGWIFKPAKQRGHPMPGALPPGLDPLRDQVLDQRML